MVLPCAFMSVVKLETYNWCTMEPLFAQAAVHVCDLLLGILLIYLEMASHFLSPS